MLSDLNSWREEKQSAWLYRELAKVEADARQAALFVHLANSAEEQAQTWEARVKAAGGTCVAFAPSSRAHLVAWLAARLTPRAIRPVLAAMKVRGLSGYQFKSMPLHHPPVEDGSPEKAHLRGGNDGSLRAAVFGVNDGLVSNTSLIMGVAGATSSAGGEPAAVLVAGVAGLLAGALSMAAGEYISMRSQREMYEYQIGLEREEIAAYPDEEAEELAQIYHARGMDLAQARDVARQMMQDPDNALDVLSREELGLNPDELGSPWGAAISSFLAFVAGAIIPLLPFLFGMQGQPALVTGAGLAVLGLFAVGAVLSLFTGRKALGGGLRMLLIGAGAGAVTYLIGSLLGAQLA
ncbi:MAG: VIT1/CCC1 transporter family protein [Halothiobacillaceae bacterium]|nr:VIT1/CCC1 transporter family protein [Halothiobacillaceae bacterium]